MEFPVECRSCNVRVAHEINGIAVAMAMCEAALSKPSLAEKHGEFIKGERERLANKMVKFLEGVCP